MDTIVVASAANVSAQVSIIPMLNGTNFQVWKATIEIVLGCMNLDIALNANKAKIEKWD